LRISAGCNLAGTGLRDNKLATAGDACLTNWCACHWDWNSLIDYDNSIEQERRAKAQKPEKYYGFLPDSANLVVCASEPMNALVRTTTL
jgi:hypothetical protein